MIIQSDDPKIGLALFCEVCREEVDAPIHVNYKRQMNWLKVSEVVDTWFEHIGSPECIPWQDKEDKNAKADVSG